ncbi:hypothetical protein [Parapedobacter koreensis]|nr:hypothetical protein [Parapedobacter koreensis]
MLDSAYHTSRYTLNTDDLYGVDETVELYNTFLLDSQVLVVFSVLPDFESKQNWKQVDIETIRDQIVPERTFYDLMREKSYTEASSAKKSMGYTLLKVVDGKYFASTYCLFEFFVIRNYPDVFNTVYGMINTGQKYFTIAEMLDLYNRNNIDHGFPLDIIAGPKVMRDRELLQREYLSKSLDINGEKAYQFWTFTDWNVSDGWNVHRGIDRFIYIPNRGIVAGSYDFYFRFKNPRDYSEEEWRQDILKEKVMLAEELK